MSGRLCRNNDSGMFLRDSRERPRYSGGSRRAGTPSSKGLVIDWQPLKMREDTKAHRAQQFRRKGGAWHVSCLVRSLKSIMHSPYAGARRRAAGYILRPFRLQIREFLGTPREILSASLGVD